MSDAPALVSHDQDEFETTRHLRAVVIGQLAVVHHLWIKVSQVGMRAFDPVEQ
jgi:hypothetical protein